MFYSLTLEKELELQPRFFGPRMREVLQQKLISEVSGSEVGEGKQNKDRQGANHCIVGRAKAEKKKKKKLNLLSLSNPKPSKKKHLG